MIKNLQRLGQDGLLNSKSYGLGKHKLWSLTKNSIIKDLGYEPPKAEIHTLFFEHELMRGEVFVSLALTGEVIEWIGEGDQKSGFRHDGMARFVDDKFYFEIERGNQAPVKLREKIARYVKHFRATKEPFYSIWIVPNSDMMMTVLELFEEFNLPTFYYVTLFDDFIQDPLSAKLTARTMSNTLSDYLSKHLPTDATESEA